jgi:signal transduction histidine kinase
VVLAYSDQAVTLRVADDGRGFDPGARTAGFGLESMRARLAQVGGALLVHSAPGQGTTIQVSLPAHQPVQPVQPVPATGGD